MPNEAQEGRGASLLLAPLMFQQLTHNSNIPGLNKLSDKSSSKLRRWIWVFVIATGFLCFFTHFSFLLYRYIESPVITESHYGGVDFVFPDVSLCYTGPYSWSRSMYANYTILPEKILNGNQIVYGIKNFWKSVIPEYSYLPLNRYTRPDNQIARKTIYQWGLTHGFARESHEAILNCKYRGNSCSFLNFTTISVPVHLNCFTFKPAAEADRVVRKGGEGDGLSLIVMDADRRNIMTEMETLDYIRGVQVVIHPPGTMPDFQTFEIAQVGYYSKIAVNMVAYRKISRKSKPCLSSDGRVIRTCPINHLGKSVVNQTFNYSRKGCLRAKIQKIFMEKCGCLSEIYDVPQFSDSKPPMDYCHAIDDIAVALCYNAIRKGKETLVKVPGSETYQPLSTITQLNASKMLEKVKCHNKVLEGLKYIEIEKQCPRWCHYSHYWTASTKYIWPAASKYAIKPLERYGKEVIELATNEGLNPLEIKEGVFTNPLDLEFIEQNFARILLFPEMESGLLLTENLAYPWSAFLSDIGGILGLWIGFSIMTIVEVLEGITTALCLNTKRLKNGNRRKQRTRRIR